MVSERDLNDKELIERDLRAKGTVKKYTWLSVGAGVIPVPWLDLAAVTAVQLKMLADISRIYGVPFQKNLGKAAIASVAGSVLPHAMVFGTVGSTLAAGLLPIGTLIKGVPVLGPVAGAPLSAAASAAFTWALGNVFIQHFVSGGTFLTFNPDLVKEHFKAEYETGRKMTAQAESGQES